MQRLTGLDAAFLNVETPANHMHVMAVAVLDPETAPEGFDVHVVRRLLEQRLHQIPAFRRRLVQVPLRLHHPLWVEDPSFDLEFHVRAAALARPGGPRELADFAAEVASRPLDRRKPLWQMWVVEGLEGGRVALVAKVHHAAVDGAAGVDVLAALVDLDPVAPQEPDEPVPWTAERIPSDAELVAGAVVSLARQPVRAARAMSRLATSALRVTTRIRREPVESGVPFTAPRLPWNAALTPHRSVAFANVSLADVRSVKDAFGVTVNDVVLAMVAGALRRYLEERCELPDRPLVAAVPVAVHDDPAVSGNNRVSVMFTRLPTDLPEVADRFDAIRTVTHGAKQVHADIGPATLSELTEGLSPALLAGGARVYGWLADRMRPAINLVVSNVRGPDFPLFIAGARLERIYPMGPILDGAGLNVTVMSYRDAVEVGFMACRETLPDVGRLADQVADALAEMTKAARELLAGG